LYHNAAFLIAKVSQYLCPPHPAPGKVGIQPGFIAPQLGQIFGVNFLVYRLVVMAGVGYQVSAKEVAGGADPLASLDDVIISPAMAVNETASP